MPLTVSLVPCLDDNYGFLVRDEATGTVAAVDIPEAEPILEALKERGWGLDLILNTHKHGDHIGGNEALREQTGATVIGPDEVAERTHVDWVVHGGDRVGLGATELFVIDTGGHTLGHISYYAPTAATVFVGDTLFAMGCGRLFEGTAEQMWESLSRLAALPPQTQVYCAHEYTMSNADFALSVDHSPAVAERAAAVLEARALGQATVPTTIGLELATNPFLRAPALHPALEPARAFAEMRRAKDEFTG
ncbi:MAG TPA: hydroxyacylglutathione hydrolase [Sphingomicrobium sp.]